jgi:hypothetical protein
MRQVPNHFDARLRAVSGLHVNALNASCDGSGNLVSSSRARMPVRAPEALPAPALAHRKMPVAASGSNAAKHPGGWGQARNAHLSDHLAGLRLRISSYIRNSY